MSGTIYSGHYRIGSSGTYTGITLSNAATQNPATLAGYLYVNSGAGILGQAGTAWTVSNQALLIDYGMNTPADDYGALNNPGGIALLSGGLVINGNTGAGGQGRVTGGGPFYADGRIEETTFGVAITGGVGTVVNDGVIKSGSLNGVSLGAGGTIVNGAANDTIAYIAAASVIAGAPGTVINYATLGHGGEVEGAGIILEAGGLIENFAGAYVKNFSSIGGAAGTVINAGTMTHALALGAGGTVVNQASGQILYGLYLNGTATLLNAGLVNGQPTLGGPGLVINTGTLAGGHVGLPFASTGTLVNGQSGSSLGFITGSYYGVSIAGTAGLITNFGEIASTTSFPGAAVVLAQGGTILNFGTLFEIGGRQGDASKFDGAAKVVAGTSLFNAGAAIGTSTGVYATGGSITNTGMIGATGSFGVLLSNAFLTNAGGTIGVAGTTGTPTGVEATSATVINSGRIAGVGAGNSTSAVTAANGAYLSGATLINSGIVLAGFTGTVASNALAVGVGIGGTIASTLINSGTIIGGIGVSVALAEHIRAGVSITTYYTSPNATIFDAGAIDGTAGIAVAFGAGQNLLRLSPGATFSGLVDGISPFTTVAAGYSTLEFAPGTGSLAGLATSVVHFRTIKVDPLADWTVSGTVLNAVSLINDGTLLANQGTLLVNAPLVADSGSTGTIAVAGHGVAAVFGTVASSQTARFIDLVGTLEIGSLAGFAGTIAGFASGDTIALLGTTASAASYANHLLTISNGATVLGKIAVSKNYTGDSFTVTEAGGNADITTNAPCFAAGTRLRTAEGEIPVEALRIGTRMVTAGGRQAPVIWLGRRRIDCRTHRRAELVLPVRILAGAFAPERPCRDLLLSPDHAIGWEDALIPVRYLVNATTIRQEAAEQVEYWHVELDSHDLLLAEGLPAESYLDTGNRAQFEGGRVTTLHPDLAGGTNLILAGAELARARAHLLARAASLGWRPPPPSLVLECDGRQLRPATVERACYRFLLPTGARMVHLVSPPWVPAERLIDAQDRRRLGVCVAALLVDGRRLPLDGAALLAGFHGIERQGRAAWRWTDGRARLRLPSRASVLEVRLREAVPEPERVRLHGG